MATKLHATLSASGSAPKEVPKEVRFTPPAAALGEILKDSKPTVLPATKAVPVAVANAIAAVANTASPTAAAHGSFRELEPEVPHAATVASIAIARPAIDTATSAAAVTAGVHEEVFRKLGHTLGKLSLAKEVDHLSSGLDNTLRAVDTVESASNKLEAALSGNLAALKKPATPASAKAAPAKAAKAATATTTTNTVPSAAGVATTTAAVQQVLIAGGVVTSVLAPTLLAASPTTVHSTRAMTCNQTQSTVAPSQVQTAQGGPADTSSRDIYNSNINDGPGGMMEGAASGAAVGGAGSYALDGGLDEYESGDEIVEDEDEEGQANYQPSGLANTTTPAIAPSSAPANPAVAQPPAAEAQSATDNVLEANDTGFVYEEYDPENDEIIEDGDDTVDAAAALPEGAVTGSASQPAGNEQEEDEEIEGYDPDNDEIIEGSAADPAQIPDPSDVPAPAYAPVPAEEAETAEMDNTVPEPDEEDPDTDADVSDDEND